MHFDEQLQQLDNELLKMAGMIEAALAAATRALSTNDLETAQRVMDEDVLVNRQERDIESLCLKLLLQQQPVARDLRLISAALKMISDLERIGDQAADICKIIVNSPVSEGFASEGADSLSALSQAAIHMVKSAVDAFVERNVDFARAVMSEDFEVNQLFKDVRGELTRQLREENEPSPDIVDRLMIAKYFERIGDHAKNIAEWVEYSQSGYHKGVFLA